jgi:hypothetical protein
MTWFPSVARRPLGSRCRPAVEALETRLAPTVLLSSSFTPAMNRSLPPAGAVVRVVAADGQAMPGGVTGAAHGGGVAPAEKLVLQRGPFTADPHGQFLVQRVSLRNEGSATLKGPLSLVLDGLPPGVRLRQGHGIERLRAAHGDGYRLATAAHLRPGQGLSVVLHFDAPGRSSIPYRLRVL